MSEEKKDASRLADTEQKPDGEGIGEDSPRGDAAQLREELARKTAEAEEAHDRFLRERAELDNFKKRVRREQADARRFASEELIRDLLPVLDNLERAVSHAQGGGNGAPLVEGVALVLKAFEDVLRQHGVRVIDTPPGAPFDPAVHEAVGRDESDSEPNRVVAQHERGYFLHERLLRAAKVVVSCPPPSKSAGVPGDDDVEKTGDDD